MARRRFRRKDLKRPDEFVSRGRQGIEWAYDNTRTLGLVGGALALGVLVILGFVSVRGARSRQANDDLTQALASFHSGNYGEATTKLGEVGSRWQSTTPGHIARLYAAVASNRNKNYESAATLLQDSTGQDQLPPYLQQAGLINLAFAIEGRGDLPAAAAKYAEAAAMDGPYTATALWSEARCREQTGEKDKARELYERYAREFPDAPDHEMASAKAAALKSV